MSKITIITPCYNSEKYIAETILSVLMQTGDFDLEYIVADGGSVDRTMEIVKDFKGHVGYLQDLGLMNSTTEIIYLSEKDDGMYDALVKGFERATGDIVAYINSDDYYQPHAFQAVVEIFNKYPEIDWITGMQVYYNQRGQITSTVLPFKYDRLWIKRGMYGTMLPFIQQEAIFWRRKLLDAVDFKRLRQFKLAGDFYLWHTFAEYAELYIVQTCLGGFRFSENQLSKQLGKYYDEFLSIADERTRSDILLGWLARKLTLGFSDTWKMRLNRWIIRYHEDTWWKADTTRVDRLRERIPSRWLRDLLCRLYR